MSKSKTKTLIRFALFIGTLVSLYFVPWPLVRAWIKPLPDEVQEQVDLAHDYGFEGIIVCVDRKGESPQFYLSGTHNRETKEAAKADALFKIASVGKLFHALAVTRLVRSQVLDLDRSLATYLPSLKHSIANADQITLRMLVQHRSGIPNFTDTYAYWQNPPQKASENLALVLHKPANFSPGSQYQYSNTNYLLIDSIINTSLTYPSSQYLRDSILSPMGLKNTYLDFKEIVEPNRIMSGYYVGYAEDLKAQFNGSMLTTAADLASFIRALNDGTAFRDSEEEALYHSLYSSGHSGLIPGYQTLAFYQADIDAVLIQFTNTVDFEGYNWSLSEAMYRRVLKILRSHADKIEEG